MLDGNRTKLVALLASGLKQVQVAAATGWSESYVSQLCAEEEVLDALEVEQSKQQVKNVVLQNGYDKLEHSIVSGIQAKVSDADFGELVRALDTVSKCNPKSKQQLNRAISDSGAVSQTVVAVHLPAFVQNDINVQTNARNEITEIDGKTMAALTATEFQSKITESKSKEVTHARKESGQAAKSEVTTQAT